MFTIIKKAAKIISTTVVMGSIATLSTMTLISHHANAAELTINISDISSEKGHIMVALYAGEEAYSTGKSKWASKVKANNSEEAVTFSDLPDGEYAIQMFHDENDNQKLDFNMLGIPKESYGFSNNVGRFGKPEYKEASFKVKENTTIAINLF